ncbi:hypothetical protein KAI19_03335 [bacterium]|nr:hypothetical protein [bacterium]
MKRMKYLKISLSFVIVALAVILIFSFSFGHKKDVLISVSLDETDYSKSFSFAQKETTAKPMNYDIYKRDLFSFQKPVQVKKIIPAKKKSSLKLKGTVTGAKDFTFCIINNKTTRKEDLYTIGSKVAGFVVASIGKDSVTLENADEKLELYINGKEKQGELSASAKSLPINVIHLSENSWVVKKSELPKIRENTTKFLSEVKIKPVFSSGKMKGFKIGSIKSSSMLSDLGIKNGDTVKKINGKALNSPKKVFELYKKFRNSKSIDLEVERNGKMQVLTYKIQS